MTSSDFYNNLVKHKKPSIYDLGGAKNVGVYGHEYVCGLYADRLVVAIASSKPLDIELTKIILQVVERNPYPPIVSAALNELLKSSLPDEIEIKLQQLILLKISDRKDLASAEMASECLAAGYQLASLDRLSKLAFLGRLDEARVGESSCFLRRAAFIAGLCWLWDRSPYVTAILDRLRNDGEVADQALYELGLIHLDVALESDDMEHMLSGLELSAKTLDQAYTHNSEFLQAQAMSATIRAVTQFIGNGSSKDIEHNLATAQEIFSDRWRYFDKSSVRSILNVRLNAEISWRLLAIELKGLSTSLEERSWLRAIPTLERIAAVRRTIIPIDPQENGNLNRSMTDRFARSFLAHEGLKAHLLAWLEDPNTSDLDRAHANDLLLALPALKESRLGKLLSQ